MFLFTKPMKGENTLKETPETTGSDLAAALFKAQITIRNLKKKVTEQDKTIDYRVQQALADLGKDENHKQAHLNAIQARIDILRPVLDLMETKAGDLAAGRQLIEKIRHSLYDISCNLSDFFSDYKIHESIEKDLRVLAGEMQQGATAFRNILDGTNHPQIEG